MVTPFAHPPWREVLVRERQIPSFITLHLGKSSVLDRDTFMKNVCLIPAAVLCPALSTGENALEEDGRQGK